ncbi:CHRD domain-containing protein [Paraglaciecola sp. 20A4]|uniref:CHRD domain-containing protein n=1 Tax=Paraglaciecola sp. 20A4 TaxID=2687288 RepID=UPI001F113345|nr:CHRD domain-containing protein [Paraglaciecola sp. 20A4]
MFKFTSSARFLQLVMLMTVMAIAPAKASLISFSAAIDGLQANAGNGTGSLATGVANMWLDDITNDFSWMVSWTGLADVTAAHFHGPATPMQNAGVQLALDSTINPSMGNALLSNQQATDLLAGMWYINIHTATYGGGEIRGQVLREVSTPGAFSLLMLPLAALVYLRRRRQ